MSSGSKVTLIAIIVILMGTGAYEIFRTEEPEGEKTAAKMAEPAAGTPAAAPEAAAPAPAPAPAAAPAAAPATDAATAPATAPATEAATAPATEAPAADATAPAPTTQAATAPSPSAAQAPAETAAAPASSFDVIRVAPDGAAVVAGQVAPGAKVSLLVDGIEIAAPVPDANGKFVALFTLPAAGAGRLMTMITTLPDGTMTEAGAAVALAATSAPAAVADAGTSAPAPSGSSPSETAASGTAATAPAAAAPDATGTTALVVTDQGAKLVQSGTPVPAEVAANVSLEVIAYPTPDSVQFAGHGKAGAFVRLYLDNAALGEAAPIGSDGAWTVTEAGIAPKIYTLRVDEVDATGKVTSRFETPFKRETPEALAAAAAQAAAASAPAPAPASETAASGTPVSGTAAAPSDAVATAPAASPSTPATSSADAAAPAPETAPAAEATAAAPAPAPAAEAPPAPPASVSVTVQPGYTLWGIARKQMGSGFLYVQVWQANKDKIKNPDLIYPGQVFTLPKN